MTQFDFWADGGILRKVKCLYPKQMLTMKNEDGEIFWSIGLPQYAAKSWNQIINLKWKKQKTCKIFIFWRGICFKARRYTHFVLIRNGPIRNTGEIWAILRKEGKEIGIFYWKSKTQVHKASLVRFEIYHRFIQEQIVIFSLK